MSPRYLITGATGRLGRLAVHSLLAAGIDPTQVIATGRAVEKLTDLATRGVQVRRADFDEPESVRAAFQGATHLLLVSTFNPGVRVQQHAHAIQAAADAGVERLVYTSFTGAGGSRLRLAEEHAGTESTLAASGVTSTVLRNAYYTENYTEQAPNFERYGLATAAGLGKVSLALRREYSEAAVAALLHDRHAGAVYELGGPALTIPEIASVMGELTGRPFPVRQVSQEELTQILTAAGVPAVAAGIFADVDRGIRDGELLVPSDDLAQLLGRQPVSAREAIAEALDAGLRREG